MSSRRTVRPRHPRDRTRELDRTGGTGSNAFWWTAPERKVHERIFPYVERVENTQFGQRERALRLACLYDPYERLGYAEWLLDGPQEGVSENVVKSAIDTASSMIAKLRPRPTFQTDDADWTAQRTAKLLDRYTLGLYRQTKVYEHGPRAFREAGVLGTGGVKIFDNGNREIVIERAPILEMIVDENECRFSLPRTIHQRKFVDRDVLAAKFPDHREAIMRAPVGKSSRDREWAGMRLDSNQVVVMEGWHLPTGFGKERLPGRHFIGVPGTDILDEPYHRDWFPFQWYRWTERLTGFYGAGIAEEIAGIQRRINKLNRFIDMVQDLVAVPRVFVHAIDAALAVKLTNRAGAIVPYKGAKPEFFTPQAVTQEIFMRLESLKAAAFEFVGISRLSAQAKKPGGIESAVAMREYNDIETERFAIQAQRYEDWYTGVARMLLAIAKEMNRGAPKVAYRTKYLAQQIGWRDVDLDRDPYTMEISQASSLPRTAAGRSQTVIEWAQAGIISRDMAMRLIGHPDLERTLSLSTAAINNIEHAIEALLEGETVTPDPYQNLELGSQLIHAALLKADDDGAPEGVLEGFRTWITQAEHIKGFAPAGAGMGAPPQAALAQQAMQLQAA